MGQTLDYLIWPALLLVLIGAVVLGVLQKRRRLRELEALAARLGFRFARGRDHALHQKFGRFRRFERGSSWGATNTTRGTLTISGRHCRLQMGDYRFREGDGDSRGHAHQFSYLLLQQPCGTTPDLRVGETGVLDWLAEAAGFADINFESAEFSRRFSVRCADKRFAYALISPAMIEHMLRGMPASLESAGCWWLAVEGEGLWNAARFERNLRWMLGFFERWPRYLLEDHGPPPARLPGFLAGEG